MATIETAVGLIAERVRRAPSLPLLCPEVIAAEPDVALAAGLFGLPPERVALAVIGEIIEPRQRETADAA